MADTTHEINVGVSAVLPVDIAESLGRVATRYRRLKIIGAVLRAILVSLLLALGIVLLMGGLPMLPMAGRWILAMAAWAGIVAVSVWFLRPTLGTVNLQSAADMVEKNEPGHEERIISAVEFADKPPPVEQGSPDLVRQVMLQAREHTGQIHVEKVLSTKSVMRWAGYCTVAVLAWLILWPLFPQMVTTGVWRIFAPWSTPPGCGLTIHVTPGNITTGQGATLEIIGQARLPPGGKPVRSMTLAMTNTAGFQRLMRMTRIGPNQFRADVKNIAASFRYQLKAGNMVTAWYRARIIARPRISELQLRYTFPAYTGLPPRRAVGKDGAIKAIIGTQVQLIVNASEPLATTSSLSMHTPIAGVRQQLPLTKLAGLEYQATFPVQYTSSYRINLANFQGIKNSDNRRWPIIAIPDRPPVIHILEPARRVRVRLDDVIPITFVAADQFGLTGVRAMVRVGHAPPLRYRIDLGITNPRQVRQQWKLSIAEQLRQADQPRAKAIFYRLEAINNCTPMHQKTRTGLHEFIIDRHLLESYQQRQDRLAYHTLNKIMSQAQRSIQRDQQRIGNLQRTAGNRRLSANQLYTARRVQQNLAETVDNLKAAAQAAEHSAFAQGSQKAATTAEHNLPQAANAVAAATFASPQQASQRYQSFASAQRNLQQTQQALGQLQRQMAQQANQQELADHLRALARQQQNLAQKMLQQPDSPAIKRWQHQLHNQLSKLVQQHKSLQTPVAAQVQPTFANLKNQLGKILSNQQMADNTLRQQLAAKAADQQMVALAARQKKLNQQIQLLRNSTKSAHQPQLNLPNSAMINAVVSNLRMQAAKAAIAGQNQIATRLNQIANTLRQESQPPTALQRRAYQRALRNQRKLTDLGDRSSARTLSTAQQQSSNLMRKAQAMQQLTQKMLNEQPTPTAATELNAAMIQTQQALHAAADQNVRQTQAALQRATGLLSQAVQRQLAATHISAVSSAHMRQLAQRATHLAQRQHQLAAATQQLLSAQSATPDHANQQAQSAQHIARQIKQAAALTKQLEQQTQFGAPDLSSSMAQAERQMQVGRQAQLASAHAIRRANVAVALEHQQSALQHIRIALDDLNGALNSPEMRDAPQYNNMIAGEMRRSQAAPNKAQGGGKSASHQATNTLPPGLNSYQQIMAAAQQVQNALGAQQQAGQGNLQAAQQAAQSLGAAGQTMNTAATPGVSAAPGAGTETSLAMEGQAGAGNGNPSFGPPASTGNPTGLSGSGGPTGGPPKPVLAMGVSPAQWRNLGPLAKMRLLNTARQNIPSGYKRMVRDYYIRLSEMQVP
ncbi:MAG: DUF4175 family protein [Phycisphaerae bacterium]